MKTFKQFKESTMHLGTFTIYKTKDGKHGVSQRTNDMSKHDFAWDHSHHDGYHDTVDQAKAYIKKRAGNNPHNIEIKDK